MLSRAYIWWAVTLAIVVPAIVLGMLYFLHASATKIVTRNTPLLISSLKIQTELVAFHLWFEELLQGDDQHNKDSVWLSLNKARTYTHAMLEGGEIPEGLTTAVQNLAIKLELQQLYAAMDFFSNLAEERLANIETSQAGSKIDQRFDAVFLQLLSDAEDVEKAIKADIEKQAENYRFLILVLASGVVGVSVLVGVLFVRFECKRLTIARQLANSKARYHELCDNMGTCVAIYSAIDDGKDFIFEDFNRAAEKAEHIQKDTLLGKRLTDIFPAVKEFGLLEVLTRVWETGLGEHLPMTFYEDNRIVGWRENYVYKLPTGEVVAMYEDLTEQKQAEADLIKSEQKFQTLTTISPVGVFYATPDGECTYVNDRWCEISGMTEEQALGPGWREALHPDDRDEIYEKWASAAKNHKMFKAEYRFLTPANKTTWVMGQAMAHEDKGGHIVGYVGSITDITERKTLEKRLENLASFDDLTGLYNRRVFELELTKALARSDRNSSALALLFIDLDGFKEINDVQGHEAGDQVLKEVATRMLELFRQNDTVGRIGGDEFAVIIEGLVTRENTQKVVGKLLVELRAPYTLPNGSTAQLSASIGIAFAPSDAKNIQQLFSMADQAMYKAKQQGKNQFVFAKGVCGTNE